MNEKQLKWEVIKSEIGFNASKFCREMNINKSTFLKMLRGEYNECRGWKRATEEMG